MTKTKIGVDETKVPLDTSVNVQSVSLPPIEQQQFHHRPTTCWYVWSIIATIFCCFPCGVIGLVHAMIAKHEGERGNMAAHRRRLFQAKCWTSWSIAIMTVLIIASLIYWGVRLGWFERQYASWCGTSYLYYQTTDMPTEYVTELVEEEIIIN